MCDKLHTAHTVTHAFFFPPAVLKQPGKKDSLTNFKSWPLNPIETSSPSFPRWWREESLTATSLPAVNELFPTLQFKNYSGWKKPSVSRWCWKAFQHLGQEEQLHYLIKRISATKAWGSHAVSSCGCCKIHTCTCIRSLKLVACLLSAKQKKISPNTKFSC